MGLQGRNVVAGERRSQRLNHHEYWRLFMFAETAPCNTPLTGAKPRPDTPLDRRIGDIAPLDRARETDRSTTLRGSCAGIVGLGRSLALSMIYC